MAGPRYPEIEKNLRRLAWIESVTQFKSPRIWSAGLLAGTAATLALSGQYAWAGGAFALAVAVQIRRRPKDAPLCTILEMVEHCAPKTLLRALRNGTLEKKVSAEDLLALERCSDHLNRLLEFWIQAQRSSNGDRTAIDAIKAADDSGRKLLRPVLADLALKLVGSTETLGDSPVTLATAEETLAALRSEAEHVLSFPQDNLSEARDAIAKLRAIQELNEPHMDHST